MLFQLLYVLFVICQLLWGSYYIGGIITPRQVMVILMFGACIVEKEIRLDKYWKLYLVFLACFGLSSAFSGYFSLFFRQLIGFYFASFIAYRSTNAMVKKYRAENVIINTFLIIGLLDAFVTVGQFLNIPFANHFVDIMHFSGTDEKFLALQNRMETMYGVAIPGIVGDVLNGYLLSFISVLALFDKDGVIKIRNVLMWIIIIIGSFCVQERSGFYSGLVFSLFVMFKMMSKLSKKYRIVIIPFFILIVAISSAYLFDALNSSDFRYNSGGDMSDRSIIYANAWEFFKQHPWGGFFLGIENGVLSHNLFLNALIFGGWLGGLMLFIILWIQFSKIVPILFQSIKNHNDYVRLLFAVAYTMFTINSLVHNLSIVSGDATIWILWGCFVALSNRSNSMNQIDFNCSNKPMKQTEIFQSKTIL